MAERDIDIVVESTGSNPFLPLGEADINRTFYDRAVKIRNLKRTLKSIHCGADGDLAPNLKTLLTEIEQATGGDLKRIGAMCLYGTSNGSGLVLALAKALQDRGTLPRSLSRNGGSDDDPVRRNPPVPGIGSLQPVNRPEISFGLDAVLGINSLGVLFAKGVPPSVSDSPPPRVTDPGVFADKRENYYTVEGNRARVFDRSPAGSSNWWWTSTQFFGEVHGEVPGWTNIRRTTVSTGTILARGPGSIDEGHHDNLCGFALSQMQHEAGLSLGNFITKLP